MNDVEASGQAPRSDDLINAWLALEALTPQIFPKQEDVLGSHAQARQRAGRRPPAAAWIDLELKAGVMPWERPQGDRQELRLDEKDEIRWYIPLGFVDMKPAVKTLAKRFESDGPKREPAAGLAIAVLAAFDEKGLPIRRGMVVSSFAWACGKVLAGELQDLHLFRDLEGGICDDLHRVLRSQDSLGDPQPCGRETMIAAMKAMQAQLRLPKTLLKGPEIAIRIIGDGTEEPLSIVNSLFLEDLHRVREDIGRRPAGSALKAYLTDMQGLRPGIDVLADKGELEHILAPEATPASRWPAPRPVALVTLQQAAVNAAVRDLHDGGLQGINGPPGTGKTTLVRDVVAHVLLERARAMAAFDDPHQAFKTVDLVTLGSHTFQLQALDPSLRGFGLVAASANNAAVENISRELPGLDSVEPSLDLRYFRSLAEALADDGQEAWGLSAAVLGRASNRRAFVDRFWWDADHSLRAYLKAPCEQLRLKDPGPPIVAAEQPPRTRAQAKARWTRARAAFLTALDRSERLLAQRGKIRAALKDAAAAQQVKESARISAIEAQLAVDEAEQTVRALRRRLAQVEQDIEDDRKSFDLGLSSKPGRLQSLFGFGESRWRNAVTEAQQALARSKVRRQQIEEDLLRATSDAAKARKIAEARSAQATEAETELAELRRLESRAAGLPPWTLAGPSLWEQDPEDLHKANPWGDPQVLAARDAVFKATMELHRAFVDAAAARLWSNLAIFMNHLKGRRVPSGPDRYIGDLWDSFFLVVPLVSTTLASCARLFDGLGSEDLGWLLIDEAGQAPPQSAVGAIWRAKRTLAIGDPLQIEPVVTVPVGLKRAIFAGRGLSPDRWSGPEASVQTLVDQASRYRTTILGSHGERVVGFPLLVHRRCAEPMFSLANEVAYGGLMVHAVPDRASPLMEALLPIIPGSCWLHVESRSEKWNDEEGDAVAGLLEILAKRGVANPDIYFISPFREVARQLKARLQVLPALETLTSEGGSGGRKAWLAGRVGTVHTFQGKEAELVVLVLGASAAKSGGARAWAGATPNILNVATTRAKRGLIVVGNHDAWADCGHFRSAADESLLPVVKWSRDWAAMPSGEKNREDPQTEVAVPV